MPVTNVEVSGDIGEFKAGSILVDRKMIAKYYRVSLNEGADRPTQLTDDEILACIDKVDVTGLGTGDSDISDIDVVRTEALERLRK